MLSLISLCLSACLSLAALADGPNSSNGFNSSNGSGAEQRIARHVLIIVLDDVGVDAIGAYAGADADVVTPYMDALAARGLRMERAWSCPSCSPTRATILTGKYGFRTGIGSVIRYAEGDPGLSEGHETLPQALRRRVPALRTGFFGKWHLAASRQDLDHARRLGFESFRGTAGNLGAVTERSSYFAFEGAHEGRPERREVYATSAVTDDAIAAISAWADEPWLVVASYHAAHKPLHDPPEALLSKATRTRLSGAESVSDRARFLAVVEALDREVGRLVESIPEPALEETLVLIVGDNGTASEFLPPQRGKRAAGKGTLLESGIRVPLIVLGGAVAARGSSPALVHTVDLLATAEEWLRGSASEGDEESPGSLHERDSVSFLGCLTGATEAHSRRYLFSERFEPPRGIKKKRTIDRLAMRDERYKLVEDRVRGVLRFFDLQEDPFERRNLLRAGAMTPAAIESLARFTAVLAGPLGRDRDRALAID